MNPLLLLAILLRSCFLSTGGFGNLPQLHQDFLARHWATEAEFGEALAIGQISPGPNGLWVVSLAYLVHGIGGALLAVVAILIPPLLVVPISVFYKRVQDHAAIEGFVRGMMLAVVGIFAYVIGKLMEGTGVDVVSVSVALGAFCFAWIKRMPVVAIIGLGTLVGILLYR